MKLRLLAALAALSLASAAQAETFSFPEDAPVASVTFPDTWESRLTDTGAQSAAPEAAVQFYINPVDSTNADKLIADTFEFLKTNGVTVDAATQTETKRDVNGTEMQILGWQGTDASGPATIQVGILETAPEKGVMITYWGTTGEEDKFAGDLAGIVDSIKPAAE